MLFVVFVDVKNQVKHINLYINCESTEIYVYLYDIYKVKLLQADGDNLHI